MNAQWQSCCTFLDGHPAVLTVDMGAGADLSGLDAPNLLRVQYVLRHPDEDGLPGAEDERRIEALRAELVEWIRAAGGRFVGEVSAAGQHAWFFYMACGWREAAQLVHRVGLRLGVALGAEMLPDARHRTYFELLPTEEEWRVHDNAQRLCALLDAGDDLRQPRDVAHYALFDNHSQAQTMGEWARRHGFTVRAPRMLIAGEERAMAEPAGTSGRWLLELSRHMRPEPRAIDADTARLMQAAARMGGVYCGWHAPVARHPDAVA